MNIDAGSLVTLGISLLAVAVAWGTIKTKVDNLEEKIKGLDGIDKVSTRVEVLEKRADEDRCGNTQKFAELYESRNEMKSEMIEAIASIKSVCARLERIEPKLDTLIERGHS